MRLKARRVRVKSKFKGRGIDPGNPLAVVERLRGGLEDAAGLKTARELSNPMKYILPAWGKQSTTAVFFGPLNHS